MFGPETKACNNNPPSLNNNHNTLHKETLSLDTDVREYSRSGLEIVTFRKWALVSDTIGCKRSQLLFQRLPRYHSSGGKNISDYANRVAFLYGSCAATLDLKREHVRSNSTFMGGWKNSGCYAPRNTISLCLQLLNRVKCTTLIFLVACQQTLWKEIIKCLSRRKFCTAYITDIVR